MYCDHLCTSQQTALGIKHQGFALHDYVPDLERTVVSVRIVIDGNVELVHRVLRRPGERLSLGDVSVTVDR